MKGVSVVMVGSYNVSQGAKTHGTGFFISHEGRIILITCKHVIKEGSSGQLFALFSPKKTKSPKGGNIIRWLGKTWFHPSDNQNETYDIACAEILDLDNKFIESLGVVPFSIGNYLNKPSLSAGQKLYATGFPIDYTNKLLEENSEDLLPPRTIYGHFMGASINELASSGFDANLSQGKIVITNGLNKSGKGMSGGAVYCPHREQLVGVLLGSVNLNIRNAMQNLEGFAIAEVHNVMECVDQLGPS